MLRLTLLRLPRLPAARSPPRAAYAVIHAYTAPQESRRYASSFPNFPADPLKPAESTSTTSEDTSSQAQTADTKETEKLGDNTTFYIPPNAESSKEHDPKDYEVEPEKPDGVRGTSGSKPSQPIGAVNIDELKEKLRVWSENAAITIRKRADQYTSSAITTFAQLGRELNKVTGYGEIESLKRQVAEQEARIKSSRQAAREAKQELEKAVQQRAKSQREVNDLLSRKSSWNDEDVVRFTALVRKDHLYEQAETQAKAQAIRTEDEVDREFTELMRVILNRYHEEQIWSDKIRSASTYGSLTVIGLNMLIFVLAILIVEPWKRRKLAQTFERKVEEMSRETVAAFEAKTGSLSAELHDQQQAIAQLVEVVTYSMQPAASMVPPVEVVEMEEMEETVPTALQSLGQLSPRNREIITVAIAASATVAGVLGWIAGSWFGS